MLVDGAAGSSTMSVRFTAASNSGNVMSSIVGYLTTAPVVWAAINTAEAPNARPTHAWAMYGNVADESRLIVAPSQQHARLRRRKSSEVLCGRSCFLGDGRRRVVKSSHRAHVEERGCLYEFGDFCLDASERLLSRRGVTVPLTPM